MFDPYYQLVGEDDVAAKLGDRTDCYRIRNSAGQTTIRYQRSGTPVDTDPLFGVAQMLIADREGARVCRFGNRLGAPQPSGAVHTLQLQRDDQKRVIARVNQNHLGFPVADNQGVATYKFAHDAKGRVVEIFFFDRDGRPVLDIDGVASYGLEYDSQDRLQRLTHRGLDGKTAPNRDGVALRWWEYDEAGNVAATSSHAVNQLLVDDSRLGYAQVRLDHDEQGRVIERRYIGPDGSPTVDRHGVHAARRWYDDHGNVAMEAFYDVKMQPAPRDDTGVARIALTRDDRGRVVSEKYAGPEGNPVARRGWDVAEVRRQYDAHGRPTRREFFDTHGQRTINQVVGAAIIGWKYGERGLTVEEFYLDHLETPTESTASGVAALRFTYNKAGYRTETVTVDAKGLRKPWLGMKFVRTIVEYDNYGNMLRRRLIGFGDRPVAHPVFGYAVIDYVYDARGYLVRTEFRDAAGKLVRSK